VVAVNVVLPFARSIVRQEEDNGSSSQRFMVFVFHLDNGFTIHALLHIVDGAFAFDNHNLQTGWVLSRGGQSGEVEKYKKD
jgi:hypothetical protein